MIQFKAYFKGVQIIFIQFSHLMAELGSFCLLALSSLDRYSHLNTKFQSNPPLKSEEAPMYWKESMLMTSIIGHTTRVRSCKSSN